VLELTRSQRRRDGSQFSAHTSHHLREKLSAARYELAEKSLGTRCGIFNVILPPVGDAFVPGKLAQE
jgi:hypothetical protein